MGRLSLKNAEPGWERREILAVKNHENFAKNFIANSDIALLIMNKAVTFSDFIHPIQLPSRNEKVVNVQGVFAGYGHVNSNSGHQQTQFHASMNSISPGCCFHTSEHAPSVVSSKNFCAKSDKSVVCAGEQKLSKN